MMAKTPSTPASKIGRTPLTTPGSQKIREEKIFVTVRVRPMSRKEQMVNDEVAWECPDDYTVLYKNVHNERMTSKYTFDRVFGSMCLTNEVYEEGAKDVALSALTGINATIFAYGQTSSGKTFTMRGITESAINDIYDHINNNLERDFVIKISALEIYNETVTDLLNPESGPLRLLDDPEKGTVVEKLVEEIPKDCQQLRHFISICEAQRQVGETILNDTSSRSHQIIRLTVESSLRENSDCIKSYIANLNFVDLAGSERASQTYAVGTRLKEGSHINRSLLTLTTVIRKLSLGRKGHIPYRDSKLTRILQPSIGGNARTAIICTMSPAQSHVEQSRNTLMFASSAKEVTNTAQVNMVVAERQLVKHLQKEVARLESERLRSPEIPSLSSSKALLMEKELRIKQMEREMEGLKHQRDLAQSQLIELKRKLEQDQGLNPFETPDKVIKCLSFSGDSGRQAVVTSSKSTVKLVHEIRKLEQLQKQLGEEANRALEMLHKEVACHRLGNQDAAETISKLLAEIKAAQAIHRNDEVKEIFTDCNTHPNLKEEIARLNPQGDSICSLEKQLESVQKSIDQLVKSLANNEATPRSKSTTSSKTQKRKKKMLLLVLSNSMSKQNILRSPFSPVSSYSDKVSEFEIENKDPEKIGLVESYKAVTPAKSKNGDVSSRECTPAHGRSSSINVKKMEKMFKNAYEDNYESVKAYVINLKERIEKLLYQKKLLVSRVLTLEENEGSECTMELPDDSLASRRLVFEEQRKQIIMLWHLCHISIVRRTQFYLLFKEGDPSDQIYMEVELRRLTWLEQHLAELGNASPALLGDHPANYVSSSIRSLKQERESLAKRVNSRLTPEEREMLYRKWDIPLDLKQRRRLQLVNKLWTDPHNIQHIQESAEVVARLIGLCESNRQIPKEMFELSFVPPTDKKPWLLGWSTITNLLHL